MDTHYDTIGVNYAHTRRPDPRIAKQILSALGNCQSVVNVGAGTGSYEPADRMVVAVEPSTAMIGQRTGALPLVIQANAESLPLTENAVDAALAILTLHHWADKQHGLEEMRRVARNRIVILTWDQSVWEDYRLIRDYLPGIAGIDRKRAVAIADIVSLLGDCRIMPVPIPYDCLDGFHGAYWRRPEAYLDEEVRAGISTYAHMPQAELETGLRHLARDIDSGKWAEKNRDLLDRNELDIGYRLIIADI